MMKRLVALLLIMCCFGCIWGFGYAFHVLPDDSWMELPLMFTSVYATGLVVFAAIIASVEILQ